MEYMMNLEKNNDNPVNKTVSNEINPNKKTTYSQTPQPSLKNVSNDMVKIIEDEINQISEISLNSNSSSDNILPKNQSRTYFFAVNKIKFFFISN